MKLWRISQDKNRGYDTYDSAIVAANTEDEARHITPSTRDWGDTYSAWVSRPDQVEVEEIGEAKEGTEAGIILASFNAG